MIYLYKQICSIHNTCTKCPKNIYTLKQVKHSETNYVGDNEKSVFFNESKQT